MKPEEKPATTLRPLGLTAKERTSPGFSPPPSRNSCCRRKEIVFKCQVPPTHPTAVHPVQAHKASRLDPPTLSTEGKIPIHARAPPTGALFPVESPLSVSPDGCPETPSSTGTARLLTCKPGFLQSTKRRVESELAMVMLVWGAGMTATAVRGTRLSEGSTVRRVFPEEKKKNTAYLGT